MPDRVATMNYVQAVNAALDFALARDKSVLVFGEDVGKGGGIFGATRELKKKHGDRVFDTPISESAILGSALGTAIEGMRPVAELMWVDFSLVAMDQIVNQIANARYVSLGQMTAPLTIRTQQGALPGSCAQHSQNLEAFFAHVPGLRVGLPSHPQDAYDMLLSAIFSDDPTLIIENRGLYFGAKAEVELDRPILAPGGARVARRGTDCSVVTWSAMVGVAEQAAEECAKKGIEIEIVDLRWLSPLDIETVMTSVRRTGRVLIAHEANVTGGFGAEIVSRISELDTERKVTCARLGLSDGRVPAAPHLQRAVLPQPADVVREVEKLMGASRG